MIDQNSIDWDPNLSFIFASPKIISDYIISNTEFLEANIDGSINLKVEILGVLRSFKFAAKEKIIIKEQTMMMLFNKIRKDY